jgi:hypothetical protein
MNWEIIDKYTKRAKVHKGWLVRHISITINNDTGDDHVSMSICFVPDAMHSWKP